MLDKFKRCARCIAKTTKDFKTSTTSAVSCFEARKAVCVVSSPSEELHIPV